MSSLTISGRLFHDHHNIRYKGKDILILLLLYPLFEVKNISHYPGSILGQFRQCGKDVFYRFMNRVDFDWRKLLYHVNTTLINKVRKGGDEGEPAGPRCLIVDDTDMPKTGRRTELIGRIFSHVCHKSVLGFKGLFMGYHDGKSFFGLDFMIMGEKGKNEKKPYGMSGKELKERYSKRRPGGSPSGSRVGEYSKSKISGMIEMVKRAIGKGIRFDYLLVDSWFTCLELVRFIKTRRIKCHLLGMVKMGNTGYVVSEKTLTAKQIADDLRRKKKVKRSKRSNCWYCETIVDLKGSSVKLFFCKMGRRGKWNGMLSTNCELGFEEAYKIYSTRWCIEVYFKESKNYLGLGKCQSRDFDAQIAHTSICVLQYNLLSVVKRFLAYETMGELFREAQSDTLELTVSERIWKIIIKIIDELAVFLEADTELLMEKLFSDNEKFMKLVKFETLMQTG